MKKIILLLIIPLFGYSQFPAENVELLLNKEIKVLPKAESLQEYGYDYFYKNKKIKKKYACCESYNSKYLSLVNQVFTVINIEPYKYGNYILELSNNEIGTVYFKYQPKFEHTFPFEFVGGITYPDGYFCKDIMEESDKFSDKVTYRTPSLDNISFTKITEDNSERYYLSCKTIGSTTIVDGKGVILLLESGEKIQWSDESISIRVNNNAQFEYSCFIRLTDENIETLKKNNVTDFRLYIFDHVVKDAEKYKEYLKCITK